MKILFIANTFPSPDTPKMAPFNLRASANLIEYGMDLKVYHLRSWKPKRKISDKYIIDNINITSVALPFYAFSPPRIKAWNIGLYKRWFYNVIKKQIDFSEINLIHTVGVAHAGIIGAYLSKKTGLPHVAQCIGSDINYILPEMKDFKGVKGFENYVDVFTGNSHSLANAAKALFPQKPAEVIYRGIDINAFFPDPAKRSNEKLVFSFIGGMSIPNTKYGKNEKGAVTLLKAWKDLVTNNPHLNVLLQFGGPRVNYDEVKLVTEENPENLKIEVTGHLNRSDVPAFLQKSHVLIIPSLWEGFPNAGVEAASCGCALIGSATGGIPEIIERANNGILTEPGNQEALKNAMLKLIEEKELLENYMSNSRPFVEKYLNHKQFAAGYNELYNQLVGKK